MSSKCWNKASWNCHLEVVKYLYEICNAEITEEIIRWAKIKHVQNIIRNEHVENSESDGIIGSSEELVLKDSCSITVDNCTLDEDVESKTGNSIKAEKSNQFIPPLKNI